MTPHKRRNLALMTPEQRNRYITETYYPEPDLEDVFTVDLLKKNAISPENAKLIRKDALIQKLIDEGQLLETENGRVYLSDEGVLIAKGSLKLYPELK